MPDSDSDKCPITIILLHILHRLQYQNQKQNRNRIAQCEHAEIRLGMHLH